MITLCRPKEDFFFEKVYATIDEPISTNLLFRHCELYAFAEEKVPVMSYANSNEDYADMVCVFYPNNNLSELVRFTPEEFDRKFMFVNYTYW